MEPCCGLRVNEASQILFEDPIHHLRLSIGLGVIGCAESEVGATSPEKFRPEVAQEYRITVGHDASGETVKFAHNVQEKISYLECGEAGW